MMSFDVVMILQR